ncbi:hypothetical protein QBC46DRAFT_454165 [Diplogelasinospora grovesii]|uniref:Serine protease n=1 Tax=Diplogelasinospora grovesii TaxID=303347 RepID=A0AAN6MVX8_9PEZI|nr:hypothetical protein QBC46DRAFT_454165 [Diplogelasinospora grovesii]
MATTASMYAGLIAAWTMNNTTAGPESMRAQVQESTHESLFDPDFRVPVDENDYRDGGKYRCVSTAIVDLLMRYEGQSESQSGWYMGTGWLIRPDLMVTAGHNVWNWAGNNGAGLGKASAIKCYIGYHGASSVGSPIVQSRLAKRVVTTAEWLAGKDNRNRDLAFVKVDRPFEGNLRLFTYSNTPEFGEEMLGVVGYPGDKEITNQHGQQEKGALMYEDFQPVNYNLSERNNQLRMLKYRISTFGGIQGQSGAPVIRKNNKNAGPVGIGTHVYGFDDKNQASPIGAKWGNDYDAFIGAFTTDYPRAERRLGGGGASLPHHESGEAESFFSVPKLVGSLASRVGKAALPIASPLLGPLGVPISAVAGAALNAVSTACAESAYDGGSSSSSSSSSTTTAGASGLLAKASQGTAERAVVAEAALQAVLSMDGQTELSQKILGDMAQIYKTMARDVKLIAPKLTQGLLSGAYRMAVDKHQPRGLASGRSPLKLPSGAESAAESADGGPESEFVAAMLASTRVVEGEEAFFDFLGPLIHDGLRVAKPLLREGAKVGFGLLNRALAGSAVAESSFDDPDIKAAELVTKRAIVAESALQAVMKLRQQELNAVKIPGEGEGGQEEAFFNFVKSAAQKIGAVVKETAPAVIKAVLPIVVDAVTKKQPGNAPAVSGQNTLTSTISSSKNGYNASNRNGGLGHRSVLSVVNAGGYQNGNSLEHRPLVNGQRIVKVAAI